MISTHAILTILLATSPVQQHLACADTLTVAQAERLLADRNANLRLASLDCAEAEALARQARRLENPEVSGLYNVRNPQNGRWLDPGPDGEVDISLNQPLPLGRRQRVRRAEAGVRAARNGYEWTLLATRMAMKRQLCELWAAQQRVRLVGGELASVERILEAYRSHPQAVAQAEVRRMETLRLNLLAEQAERQRLVDEGQAALALMLGMEETGFAVGQPRLLGEPPAADSSLAHSALMQHHAALCEAAEAEVRLQRALSLPRVSLGAEYDKNGNIGHHFWAVGVSISLPLFDRNRGGIRAAEVERDRQQALHRQAALRLRHETSLQAMRIGRCRQLEAEAAGLADWNIEGIERQYLARNLSLLEFIDLHTAWREAQERLLSARLELLSAAIDYNLALGQEACLIED